MSTILCCVSDADNPRAPPFLVGKSFGGGVVLLGLLVAVVWPRTKSTAMDLSPWSSSTPETSPPFPPPTPLRTMGEGVVETLLHLHLRPSP